MAVSDNERTFVPAELDVLEDALELPSTAMPRLPADLDDGARARIHDALIRYRAIERHAQALLREHEAPASVLASVMAEARAAAAATPTPAVPTEPPRKGLWSRLRMIWVLPTLAAAGGAALVAVMVVRPDASPTATTADARVARAEAPPQAAAQAVTPTSTPPLADASSMRDGAGLDVARGDGLMESAAAEPVAPELRRARTADEAEEPQEVPQTAPQEAPQGDSQEEQLGAAEKDLAKRNERKSSGPMPATEAPGGGAVAPKSPAKPASKKAEAPAKPMPDPKPAPSSGNGAGPHDSAASRLVRADDARRRGDCAAAKPDYQGVVASGTAKQRARARAGLALCLEREGQRDAARTLFDQARADDAAIDAWISTQR